MKVYIIILTIFMLGFTSCNDWLDITPTDTVVEEQLFAEGDGFRNVLNGVYKQMATSSLYGRELSWGMLDVLGQLYHSRAFSTNVTYGILLSSYNYEHKDAKSLIEQIWSLSYNSIANSNSILAKIDGTDSTSFRSLNNEKMLIKGEALALRAFLHFDMLRLFAPNPKKGDQTAYIPYFREYPSTFEPNLPTKDVLELAIQDLEEARTLVAPHDTLEWKNMLGYDYRIGTRGKDSKLNPDLFFRHRGFRMNYLAICAVLARVYNYYGVFDESYYQKAYDIADHVMSMKSGYYKLVDFTDYYYLEGNRKATEEVIFCLSNQKLLSDYEALTAETSYNFYLRSDLFDDNGDERQGSLTSPSGSYRVCVKNILPSGSSYDYEFCKDMLPLFRLSELYYIQAEVLARQGKISEAVKKIDVVRGERNCQTGNLGIQQKINDWDSFAAEMVKEAARDFMQEGQVFFYYKRFNILPKSGMKETDMTLPKPDNEVIF